MNAQFQAQRETRDYQAADAAHHIHAFLDQKALNAEGPRVIVGGERLHLWDNDGKRYLDGMSGLWCTNLGYGRKDLTAAATRQLEQLPYYNMFFHTTHPAVVELSELLFSLLPPMQAVADTIWLKEPPALLQLLGGGITIGGIALYLPRGGGVAWGGLLLMLGTLVLSTIATTLTRHVARQGATPTLHLTLVSTGAGALVILPVGVLAESAPHFPAAVVGALLWLAVANTAVAFSLWNHALRTLTAFEANVIANTTVFQVGVLAWLFLGEGLTARQILAMCIAFGGVLLAQLPAVRARRR